jgi:uncharacterized protein (DUF488 family)
VLALLRAAGVSAVADVRAIPGSRRHPQFRADSLARWLPDAGIAYSHLPELGGRRRPATRSRNGAWRESAFQGYADHMSSMEFAEGLRRLERLGRHQPTAIMCAEAVWWRCHRRLIADALTARRWRVEHLGVGTTAAVHELSPFAVIEQGGGLLYPPESIQESLFTPPPGGSDERTRPLDYHL